MLDGRFAAAPRIELPHSAPADLRELHDVCRRLSATRGVRALVDLAAPVSVATLTGAESVAIWLAASLAGQPSRNDGGTVAEHRRRPIPAEVLRASGGAALSLAGAAEATRDRPGGDGAGRDGVLGLSVYPLTLGDQALGVLGLYGRAPLDPSTDELVRVVASYLAVLLAHAQLQRRERRRDRQAATLNRISEALNQEQRLDPLLRLIADAGRSLTGARLVRLFTLHERAGAVGFTLVATAGRVAPPFPAELAPGARAALSPLLDGCEVLRAGDVRAMPRLTPALTGETGCFLGVPVTGVGKRVIGAMLLEHPLPHHFGEEQETLAQALAGRAWVALANVRLLERTRTAAARVRTLNELGHVLSSILERPRLLRTIREYVAEAMDAPAFVVAHWDEAAGRLEIPTCVEDGEEYGPLSVPLDAGPLSQAVLEGEPYYIRHFDEEAAHLAEEVAWRGDPALGRTQSQLAVPMSLQGRVVGALSVQSPRPYAYSSADVEFLWTIAQQAAVSLENARLYEELAASRTRLAGAVAELREADRMKDYFLSVASHELRTPLTMVRGQVQLLERDLRNGVRTERTDRRTQSMLRNMDRMARLIDALFDASRLRTGRLPLREEPVELRALCAAVAEGFEAVTVDTQVMLDALGAPVVVLGDPDRLEQVVLNLVSNAVAHSPPGSAVVVRVHGDGDVARVAVTDEGDGIPPEDLPRVFDRFYQVEARKPVGGAGATSFSGGLGLGLFLSRGIVEAHGGRIRAESEVGAGATFTFELPLAPA